jgi:hypothetical protein
MATESIAVKKNNLLTSVIKMTALILLISMALFSTLYVFANFNKKFQKIKEV